MKEEPFFVGYLPLSPSLRRFVLLAAGGALALLLALALATAATQRDPGDARWDVETPVALEGLLLDRPAPLLRTRLSDGALRSVLLVSEGKRGLPEAQRPAAPVVATARGYTLRRGRWLMLEVQSIDVASGPPGEALAAALPEPSPPRRVVLRGEIIDPKCYLGAMKPGDGKPHKACATLCIRGGVPPMFRDDTGALHLLVDDAGRTPDGDDLEALLPYVADPVEVEGDAFVAGDLSCLRILNGAIKRL